MRALAIVGPRSTEQDLAPFRGRGAEIVVVPSLAQTAGQVDAALVLGGDGTVQRHLAGLLQAHIPLVVVPRGSANDFARALGLRTPDDALRAWTRFLHSRDNVEQIDAGVIRAAGAPDPQDPVHFCCAAGAGLDAEVARRANCLPGWLRAHGGYVLAAIPALASYTAQAFTVTASDRDGRSCRTLSEPGFLVAVANAPWYGHSMRIAPQASLDDGELDVCLVRAMNRLRLLRLFPKVYRGKHVGLQEVEYFRAARLRIESEHPLAVHADGEPAGTTPVEISVLPRALRVIVGTST